MKSIALQMKRKKPFFYSEISSYNGDRRFYFPKEPIGYLKENEYILALPYHGAVYIMNKEWENTCPKSFLIGNDCVIQSCYRCKKAIECSVDPNRPSKRNGFEFDGTANENVLYAQDAMNRILFMLQSMPVPHHILNDSIVGDLDFSIESMYARAKKELDYLKSKSKTNYSEVSREREYQDLVKLLVRLSGKRKIRIKDSSSRNNAFLEHNR